MNRAQEDTLLVGVPPEPRTGTVATRGIAAVVKSFLGASPVTWILGARGSGRTTAVRAAALACDRFGGICRVDCGAVRLEESLSRVAAFFEQLGHGELQDVLEQRSTLESKAAVLAHLVRETSVLLWWEDADKLSRGRREHPALRVLLDRLTTPLGDAPKGHVVLTAPTAPANVSTPLELIAPTPAEALALWSSWGGDPGAFESALASLPPLDDRRRILPLHLRLALTIANAGGELAPEDWIDTERLGDLVRRAGETLSREAVIALECIAAHATPVPRRTLRLLSDREGAPLRLDPSALEPALRELVDGGWIELEPSRERWHCAMSATLVEAVTKWRAGEGEARWRALVGAAGDYHADTSRRTGDWWSAFRAYQLFARSGRSHDAHQVTRLFVENLLRFGYFDLGEEVLEELAEGAEGSIRCVALGNLAIVAKSRGDHDRALELYVRARRELEKVGDWPNVARILHQIGNTLYLKNDFQGALGSYEESLRLSLEHDQPTIATATKVQIANVLWSVGELAEARARYAEAASEIEASGERALLAAVYLQLGQIDLREGRAIEAEGSFRRAEESARAGGDRRNVLKALRGLAVVAQELQDRDRARTLWLEAERTALVLGDWAEIADCRLARGDLETRLGRFVAALEAHQGALLALDELERSGASASHRLRGLRERLEARIEEARRHVEAPADSDEPSECAPDDEDIDEEAPGDDAVHEVDSIDAANGDGEPSDDAAHADDTRDNARAEDASKLDRDPRDDATFDERAIADDAIRDSDASREDDAAATRETNDKIPGILHPPDFILPRGDEDVSDPSGGPQESRPESGSDDPAAAPDERDDAP